MSYGSTSLLTRFGLIKRDDDGVLVPTRRGRYRRVMARRPGMWRGCPRRFVRMFRYGEAIRDDM
jgi:hypothetical protein